MTWGDPERALVRPPRRRSLAPILVPQILTVALAVGATAYFRGDDTLSDEAGRVTVTVPRSWSDHTPVDAGAWDDNARAPDLAAASFLGERDIAAFVAQRNGHAADQQAAEVDRLCGYRACVSRGQPVAVEVNGRPGVQQVLTHAGAEWTMLLTLESADHLVSVTGRAAELAGPDDVDALQAILRTVVLTS